MEEKGRERGREDRERMINGAEIEDERETE